MPGAHLAPRARRTVQQRLIVIGGAFLAITLFLGASAGAYVMARFGQITRVDVKLAAPPPPGEPRNYLIVGSDSREGLDPSDPGNQRFLNDTVNSGKRTDTIMILRLEPATGTAALLSLPRDLWVPIAGTGSRNRINSAFTLGVDVLTDTIAENFGIPVHHYVEVDFQGFERLVDAVGGVPFYFDSRVRDKNSGLFVEEPGCVTLDPVQALGLARSRYLEIYNEDTGRWRSDPSGDLGRISRQQEFIRRAIARAKSKGLSNPVTLNELVGVAVGNVSLDATLSLGDIRSLASTFASFDPETLITHSLPVRNFRTAGGAAVLDLQEAEAEPVFNLFRGLDPDEVSPALITVAVFNGTSRPTLAGDITAALGQIGFETEPPADTVEQFAGTKIYYARGSENAAKRLARHLSVDVEFGVDASLDDNELVLVAGADFTTVHDQPSPTIPEELVTTTTTRDPESSTTVAPSSSTTSTTAPIGYLPDADAPIDCI